MGNGFISATYWDDSYDSRADLQRRVTWAIEMYEATLIWNFGAGKSIHPAFPFSGIDKQIPYSWPAATCSRCRRWMEREEMTVNGVLAEST